jgi:agmatinase
MEYKVSEHIITTNPEKSVVMNRRTGEQYSLNKETLQFLKLFIEPVNIESVIIKFDSVEEKRTVSDFVNDLIESGLLVENIVDDESSSYIRPLPISKLEKPVNTFFSVPYKALDKLPNESIAFVGFPYDQGTTGLPGTRFGSEKIRLLTSSNFDFHADIFTGKSKGWFSQIHQEMRIVNRDLFDIGDILINIGENPEVIFQRLNQVVSDIFKTHSLPVAIGGDHSLSYSMIKAYHDTASKPCSVIHFDAHSDIGGYCPEICHNHGNVFSRVLHEKLCEEIHQIGLRTTYDSYISGVFTYPMETLQTNLIEQIVDSFDQSKKYHLSIDIDVLDPIYAPGTGTPVPNGMSLSMLIDFLTAITKRCDIVSIDLVEVNPMVDVNHLTQQTASQILFHILSCLF